MSREILQPKGLFESAPLGFSQVVTSPPGKQIFLAGQVGVDTNLEVVSDDLGAQAKQAASNVICALEAAGASVDDLMHVRVFVVNLDGEGMRAVGPALESLKGSDGHAAQTMIGVQALALPTLRIEIEATAVVS
jgi:enamine deaminase RidA (YjgF/YER057c/UK114 family)